MKASKNNSARLPVVASTPPRMRRGMVARSKRLLTIVPRPVTGQLSLDFKVESKEEPSHSNRIPIGEAPVDADPVISCRERNSQRTLNPKENL